MRKNVSEYSKQDIRELILYYREGLTLKDIAELTNLTYYEVLFLLKKYLTELDVPESYMYEDIPDNKILIVSDTHIGSYKENLDYLREAYRVAAAHGIKTAIHGGDLIQSTFSNVNKKYANENRQIDHLLNTYPTGIENYIILGNHDYNTVKKDQHYLEQMGSRDDFHIMGIKRAYLSWQGHPISLYHSCDKYKMPIESLESILYFKGHSHYCGVNQGGSVHIPTLSDDLFDHNNGLPGFLIGSLEDGNLRLDSYYYYKDSLREKPKILTKKL